MSHIPQYLLADLSDKNAKSKPKPLTYQGFQPFRYSLAQNGKYRYFLEGKRIKKAENTAFFAPFGRTTPPLVSLSFSSLPDEKCFWTKTSDLTAASNRPHFSIFQRSPGSGLRGGVPFAVCLRLRQGCGSAYATVSTAPLLWGRCRVEPCSCAAFSMLRQSTMVQPSASVSSAC